MISTKKKAKKKKNWWNVYVCRVDALTIKRKLANGWAKWKHLHRLIMPSEKRSESEEEKISSTLGWMRERENENQKRNFNLIRKYGSPIHWWAITTVTVGSERLSFSWKGHNRACFVGSELNDRKWIPLETDSTMRKGSKWSCSTPLHAIQAIQTLGESMTRLDIPNHS